MRVIEKLYSRLSDTRFLTEALGGLTSMAIPHTPPVAALSAQAIPRNVPLNVEI
jgi:hypothetical protein